MNAAFATLAFVALQRAAELGWAGLNTARLRRQGALESDPAGYPWLVALHAGWLATLLLLAPSAAAPSLPLLGLFALLQPARLWVMLSLGRFWTTRVVSLPGVPLVTAGPYRWLRHPNYLIVSLEIAIVPLAFGMLAVAAAFSALNLMLIARRIAVEERALAPRRAL